MTFHHPSALVWAQEHSLAAPVRLGVLEVMAFQQHPEIYALFGSDGALRAERESVPRRSAARRGGATLVIILAVLGAIAPIAGMAVIAGDEFDFFRMDASRSVPIAGVCFTIAALAQLVLFIGWLVSGARFSGLLFGAVVVAAVTSAFTLAGIPNISAIDGFEGWEAWYAPVLICLGISVISAVAMLLRFRVRAPETSESPPVLPSPTVAISTIRSQVAALPYPERQAIAADRDAALATLQERGLIDESQRDLARTRDLGTLFVMDGEPAR